MNKETMVSGRSPIKHEQSYDDVNNATRVNIVAGSSSGTQYTEDAAAAANPVGTAVNLVRQDTPSALVTTDGDNVTQRGTNYGAAYAQIVTSAGAFVDTFGGGTQFADGAARSTATGTIAMVDDGTNIQSMKGDASGRPLVTIDTALPAGTAILGNVGIDQTTPGTTNLVDTELPAAAVLADASANPTAPDVGAKNSVYNGATWDLQREVNSTANTTGAGIPAVGMYAQFDDVAPTAITENRYGNVRMSGNRNLYGTIRDAAGNERGANVSANGELSTIPSASASATGLTVSKTDAQTATVTAVKASAGRVHGYHIFNSNTVDIYFHFYDIASGSVTVGTSTRTRTLWIPSGGAIDSNFAVPLTFGTAISIAATTTITGSSAPSTGLLVDVDYI